MSDERKIRFGGEELGEFSIRQVMRMAEKREIDHTAEYWSEKGNEWRRLPSFIMDFDDQPDRVGQMKAVGIKITKVLGADASDCPVCKALQEKVFAVKETPVLPPEGCTCVPWCRCIVIAETGL
jgi:hypothetical protein